MNVLLRLKQVDGGGESSQEMMADIIQNFEDEIDRLKQQHTEELSLKEAQRLTLELVRAHVPTLFVL